MKKQFLLFLTLFVLSISSYARKFYFSSTGSDAYTSTQAQSSATPWKTLTKLQSFATSGAAAGDTFAFKCGDVFIGPYDRYGSIQWGSPFNAAPSGTALNPIVFTSYGTGEKPNFLFPTPSNIAGNARIVFAFDRTNYIIFDGVQFNDYRFPANDKVSTCYTKTGILVGEEGASSNNITIKNCTFNNVGCGIEAAGNRITILNNTFTNLKNFGDTATMADIGCVPMSIASGKYYLIKGNYIKGGWGFSGVTASGQGLNGVGIELVNDIDSSLIIYNTIVDCAGAIEYGNITGNPSIGMNCDTFAYNKFINNGNMAYLGVSSAVCSNLKFWNNFYVENQWSRFSGPRFGTDIYGDGQSFSGFPSWPTWPKNPTTANFGGFRMIQYPTESTTVADTLVNSKNNIVWLTTGLQAIYTTVSRPKYFHTNNIYHLTGANTVLGGSLTATERIINTKLIVDSTNNFPEYWNFAIGSDTSYAVSNGYNVGISPDFGGFAVTNPPSIGIYEYDAASIALPNVLSISPSTGSQGVIVTLTGANFTGATSVILRTGVDASLPFTIVNSTTITTTVNISSSQYVNAQNGGMFIVTTPNGSNASSPLFKYNPPINSCTFTYSAWSACSNNVQTRTYTSSPAGCSGTPPTDSLTRSCTSPVLTSFYFNADYASLRIVCNISGLVQIQNSLGQVVVTYPYAANGAWVSIASLPVGNYTAITYGSAVTFSTKLQLKLASITRTTCRNSSDGSITVKAYFGTGGYTYSINSTTNYVSSPIFSSLAAGTYTIRVKDSSGTVVSLSVKMSRVAGSICYNIVRIFENS
jgi:hypothetical protein